MPDNDRSSQVSRRKALQRGVTAAAGSIALAAQSGTAAAQSRPSSAGRRFRAFVRHGTTASVEELKLLPIQPREVVIRTEASAPCYTITGNALGANPARQASIVNHSGVGVVEEVGPMVRRVQVGDRVIVPCTPQCGQCYSCLHGRPDYCAYLSVSPRPIAEMSDGTPVTAFLELGGITEIMVVKEEYCCPVFTDVPAAELAQLADSFGTGLGTGMILAPIEAGSNVLIFGAGGVGLGAVQAARIMAAGQIIVVEPIAYRREIALKLGATTVLDPNAEGNNLAGKIRDLCKGPTDRIAAGGRRPLPDFNGADFAIEAVGPDRLPPKVEKGPDPTGILPMQQAWELTSPGGHVAFCGFGQPGNVSFPATQFANRDRSVHASQFGGIHMMRDMPRLVKLIERGFIDMKPLNIATFPLDRAREAVEAIAYRTVAASAVMFS
jgi:S-(hydroxymethyl)glutathione dehydrogenase/alcohol dehydrogenase